MHNYIAQTNHPTTTMRSLVLFLCGISLLLISPSHAVTVGSGGDYATIQDALNALGNPGGTVTLLKGTHTGEGNCGVDFAGAGPTTVEGDTIGNSFGPEDFVVDCEYERSGFHIRSMGPFNLFNVTIRNAILEDSQTSDQPGGAALSVDSVYARLINVRFENNANRFSLFNNSRTSAGGALFLKSASIDTAQNLVFKNNSAEGGGAIAVWSAYLKLENTTFQDNSASYFGSDVMVNSSTVEAYRITDDDLSKSSLWCANGGNIVDKTNRTVYSTADYPEFSCDEDESNHGSLLSSLSPLSLSLSIFLLFCLM